MQQTDTPFQNLYQIVTHICFKIHSKFNHTVIDMSTETGAKDLPCHIPSSYLDGDTIIGLLAKFYVRQAMKT